MNPVERALAQWAREVFPELSFIGESGRYWLRHQHLSEDRKLAIRCAKAGWDAAVTCAANRKMEGA